MEPTHAREPGRSVAPVVALLAAAGALLAAGGVAHPHVPGGEAAQALAVTSHALWNPAHWALTLGQALAVPAVLLYAARHRSGAGGDGTLAAGAATAAAGFTVGALGTLLAATALPAAAEAGDASLYHVANAATLAVGWLCLLLASVGGVMVGAALGLARRDVDGATRVAQRVVLAGSLALLAGVALVPPPSAWLHDVVLRVAAAVTGVGLVALAGVEARLSPRATRADSRAAR